MFRYFQALDNVESASYFEWLIDIQAQETFSRDQE